MPEQDRDFGPEHRYEDAGEPSSSLEISAPAPPFALDRRLDTLVRAIGEELAQEFFWIADTDTIRTYEHRLSFRHVHIDSVTGRFCNQQRVPLSMELALAHALPSLQPSSSQWMLAPIVLEPDLLPFVRRADSAASDEVRSLAVPEVSPTSSWLNGLSARVYRRLQVRFRAIGTYAKAATVPLADHVESAGGNFQGRDLSLSAFTRRVA